jgi:hypothetical protein
MMSAPRSATMIVAALVLADGTNGMTEASHTRSPSMPRTFRSGVTIAFTVANQHGETVQDGENRLMVFRR